MPHPTILSVFRSFSIAAILLVCGCPRSGDLMRIYGYTELQPPSNLLSAGALVAILSRDPFQAAIVCGPEASLGPGLQLVRSNTSSSTLKKLSNSSFQLDAGFMDMLRANGRMEAVGSITAKLSNATIMEVRDEDVLRGLHLRSHACSEAVRHRLEAGYTITMISSGLVGDVTYSVQWEHKSGSELSKSEKIDVLKDLALTLGASEVNTSSSEIHSTGLVWGIRDDEYLSALAIPDLDETAFERGTRHIPVQSVAKVKPAVVGTVLPPDYVGPKALPEPQPGELDLRHD